MNGASLARRAAPPSRGSCDLSTLILEPCPDCRTPRFSWSPRSGMAGRYPPAHSMGITIQCYARVCVCAYVHIWDCVDGGGVRYCVASAHKIVETAFAIPIPSLSYPYSVGLCLYSSRSGVGDPDPYPIPILMVFLSKLYES